MTHRKRNGDLREIPSYGFPEVSHYLGISQATLRSWVFGRSYFAHGRRKFSKPLVKLYNPDEEALSFYNLVELHILLFTRQIYGLRMSAVRNALEYVEVTLRIKRPLISQVFHTDGKDLFVKRLKERIIINASKLGQLEIGQIMELYLERIEWDREGLAMRLFPVRATSLSGGKIIVIDPRISFGRPVINGTGITASILYHRKRTGETVKELSKDYGLQGIEIEEAISYYKAA